MRQPSWSSSTSLPGENPATTDCFVRLLATPAVDLPRGLDLRRGQAIRCIPRLALNNLGIELALQGILNNAVLDSIDGIASAQGGGVDHGPLFPREIILALA